MLCLQNGEREKDKKKREEVCQIQEENVESNGKKRVREVEIKPTEEKIEGRVIKYIGEIARSCYKRQKEHFTDYRNLYVHQNIKMEELESTVRVRVIGRYRSSFERQIGESIYLNNYLKNSVTFLNSRN